MSNRKRSGIRINSKPIKGKILRIPASTQSRYVTAIDKYVIKMTAEVSKELHRLFKSDFAKEHFGEETGMDASVGSQARILMNALTTKWEQLFGKLALGLSATMTDGMNRASANGSKASVADFPNLKDESAKLTISLRQLSPQTKELLKAATASSTSFIKSVPDNYMNTVSNGVYNSIVNGNGLADLVPLLDKQESKVRNWAHNTAMDQTRKVYNGLNAGRMKKIGITKGEWIHSGGSQHPRPMHQDFDGQIFDLSVGAPVGDDGGNMVMPGEEPNCRCTFAPVVEFNDDDDDEQTNEESDDEDDAEPQTE